MITEIIARRALDQHKGRLSFPFVRAFEVRKTVTGNYVVVLILKRPLRRGEYAPSPILVNDFGQEYRVIVQTEFKRG